MRTLEQYFRDETAEGKIDFSLRVTAFPDKVTFYIHASSKDSHATDYELRGNELKTVQDTYVAKQMEKKDG
jgi:hypothetical protein